MAQAALLTPANHADAAPEIVLSVRDVTVGFGEKLVLDKLF